MFYSPSLGSSDNIDIVFLLGPSIIYDNFPLKLFVSASDFLSCSFRISLKPEELSYFFS